MGLFDGLAGQLASQALGAVLSGNHAQGGQGGAGDVVSAIFNMVQGHQGGLAGLVGTLAQSGLADQVASWVGTGQNMAVDGNQINNALGSGLVGNIASQLGLSPEMASGALAQFLPMVIDQLTPNGQVENHGGDMLQQGLSAILGSLNKQA